MDSVIKELITDCILLEKCALMGYYVAGGGIFLTDVSRQLIILIFRD
jgi:hypothetical protein